MCPQGHPSTEYTYNVAIYSSLLCSMAYASAVSESVLFGGKDLDLKGLYLLTSSVTLGEFWNDFGFSFPICKVEVMLAPFLVQSL